MLMNIDLDIESILDDALDAACLSIQDRIGVEQGDLAALYFSGSAATDVKDIFRDYVCAELSMRGIFP